MRISTAWSQQLGVNAMLAQQVKMSKTQMQLSTGLNVLTPADDPVAAVRTLDLQESIDKTAQYQDNIWTARSRLNIEEASLASAETVVFRAKELTIQALNAPVNSNDRLSIKYEIDQLLDNMVGIANTRNANGEYIFAGDLSNVPPFAWNGDANAYVYQGGVNQRTLDIAPERRVADGDLGSEVFQRVDTVSQEGNATVNGVESNRRSIMDTLQTLSEALAGSYDIPEAAITGNRFVRNGFNAGAGSNFTLTDDTPSVVTVALSGNYSSLDDVVSAINSQLTGNNMQAIANGNHLQFISKTQGQASTIQINEAAAPQGTFLADFGFNDGDNAQGVDLGGVIVSSKLLTVVRDYSAEPSAFELVDQDGNAATVILNSNHATVNALITDIEGQLAGSGFAVVKGENGVGFADPLTFQSISGGAASSVTINTVNGGFLVDAGFQSGQTGRIFERTVNDALADLDLGLESLLKARTSVGARLHALDDQENQNDKFTLDMESTLSEIRDLDYAEAISRFNIENTALQAAQQAFSRVQNLSLFNYL